MRYPFTVFQCEADGHRFWVAKSTLLKGCVGQGDTPEEAMDELNGNEVAWLETAEELDIPIPEVPTNSPLEYSGKMTLRVAPTVHRQAAENAKREGISLNQYINNAVVTLNAKMAVTG